MNKWFALCIQEHSENFMMCINTTHLSNLIKKTIKKKELDFGGKWKGYFLEKGAVVAHVTGTATFVADWDF